MGDKCQLNFCDMRYKSQKGLKGEKWIVWIDEMNSGREMTIANILCGWKTKRRVV